MGAAISRILFSISRDKLLPFSTCTSTQETAQRVIWLLIGIVIGCTKSKGSKEVHPYCGIFKIRRIWR